MNIYLNEQRMDGAGHCNGLNVLFGLDELCKKFNMNKNHKVLELGTADGVSTSLFANYANEVHTIDLNCSEKLKINLNKYSNIKFHQIDILDITNFFKNNYFDFIYIDACHDRISVLRDIGISLNKLKNNGVICGHDYFFDKWIKNDVMHAVHTVFLKEKIHTFSDTSWAAKIDKNKIFNDNIYLLIFNSDNYNLNQDIKNKLSVHFTKIFDFDKKSLKMLPNSENICNTMENEPGKHIGHFNFKPFLIDYVLKNIPENSTLLYHDGNFIKYPKYWNQEWENIKNLSQLLLYNNDCDVHVGYETGLLKVRQFVKTYTLDNLFTNSIENAIVKNCYLFGANKVILKNTEFSRNFIKEWMELCLNIKYVSCQPNTNPDTEFKWCNGDQDVLNCLLYRYILNKKLPASFPKYYFPDRIMTFRNLHRDCNFFLTKYLMESNLSSDYNFLINTQ